MYLLDLPDEVLAQIAITLTFVEIARLQTVRALSWAECGFTLFELASDGKQVCKPWQAIVVQSSMLQYAIELGIVGRAERGGVPTSLAVQDKCRLLREDLELWSRGDLRHVGAVRNSPRSITKASLVNCGIFSTSHPRRDPVPEGVNPKCVFERSARGSCFERSTATSSTYLFSMKLDYLFWNPPHP